jgi:hypothetical protein
MEIVIRRNIKFVLYRHNIFEKDLFYLAGMQITYMS